MKLHNIIHYFVADTPEGLTRKHIDMQVKTGLQVTIKSVVFSNNRFYAFYTKDVEGEVFKKPTR